jgi:Putative sensor
MTTLILQPFRTGARYRAVLFYLAELALGAVGFTLIVAGWSITAALAITPLVVPLLIGLRIGVGALAQAEAYLVRNLLGVEVRSSALPGGSGFWSRGFAALRDGAFWRQQAHLLLAWPIALIPLALLSLAGQLISLPLWYRWADSSNVFGFLEIDSFAETLPVAVVGLALLVVTANLLGPYASLTRWLASLLLGVEGEAVVRPQAEVSARRLRALTINALVSTAIALTLVVIWALTTGGYFWPIWPLLSLALVVGVPGWIVLVLERRDILGSRSVVRRLRSRSGSQRSSSAFSSPSGRSRATATSGRSGRRSDSRSRPPYTRPWSTDNASIASNASKRAAPARSRSRKPSSAGSSATSTTAPKRAS